MKDPRRVIHQAPSGVPHATALAAVPHVVVVGAGIAGSPPRPDWPNVVSPWRFSSVSPAWAGGWPADRTPGGRAAGRHRGGPINRGFHAFFRQYYNLRELLKAPTRT